MFLERKFARKIAEPHGYDPPLSARLPGTEWSRFPDQVRDVFSNIQLLLAARRRYDHVLPNFGLSPNEGQLGRDALLERLKLEVPETLQHYERRFEVVGVEIDVDDNGADYLCVSGRIKGFPALCEFRFSPVACKIERVDVIPERER